MTIHQAQLVLILPFVLLAVGMAQRIAGGRANE